MRKLFFVSFFVLFISFFINSKTMTFYVSFFNNSNGITIVKIIGSPSGAGSWIVIYNGSIGEFGAQKLIWTGEFCDWDFKAVDSNGNAYMMTLNPVYRQGFAFSEMKPVGPDSSSEGDTEYTVRIKNMTGNTVDVLLVRPAGSGEFQQIPLNNMAHNQGSNIKFKGPAGVTDWDVGLFSSSAQLLYVKANVDIKVLLKFTADDYIDIDGTDGGENYYDYDEE